MRSREEILRDYKEALKNNRLVEIRKRVWQFENQGLREKLQKEYDKTLPEDQRLAIYLHEKLCTSDHTAMCSWYYELDDNIGHNWNSSAHKRYLKMAKEFLKEYSYDDIVKFIETLKRIQKI